MPDLNSIINNFEDSKEDLMRKLAQNAKQFFIKQFNSESWNGKSWQEAKDGHHPLLVKSGKLKSDLENMQEEVNRDGYSLRLDNDYAEYHNDGTDTIPQREFMGESPELLKEQEEIVREHITRILHGI